MTLRPLGQAPLLLDQSVGLEGHVLSGDIAVEDGEFPTDVGSIKLAGRTARECRNALGVREGRVHLLGRGAELISGGQGHRVDGDLARGRGRGRGRCGRLGGLGRSLGLGGLGVVGWGCETRGWVLARGMLDVLAMLSDQGRAKLRELLADLRNDLRANEILHGLLGGGVGVGVNFELSATPAV